MSANSAEPMGIGRTLQLVTSTDRRGAEVFATDLQAALASLGRAVTTLALTPGGSGGLSHDTLASKPASVPTLVWAARLRLGGIDVVAAHGSRTLPVTALATMAHPTPFVYRNIGDPRFWVADRLKRLRVTAMLRRARGIAALWPRAAQDIHRFHGIPSSRIHIIPNAVPATKFAAITDAERTEARTALGLNDDEPVVAWVGALSAEKAPQVAIEAVSALEGVHLLIAGDGPMRGALQSMSVGRAVSFLGQVPDPGRVLAAADVLLLTSRTEGMPAVLIEAGLRGLPVVATDVGAVAEIVQVQLSGILVQVDDVTHTAAALRRALEGGPEMGAAGREHCLRYFTFDTVGPLWDDLLTTATASS